MTEVVALEYAQLQQQEYEAHTIPGQSITLALRLKRNDFRWICIFARAHDAQHFDNHTRIFKVSFDIVNEHTGRDV